jgi:hypothetical protein
MSLLIRFPFFGDTGPDDGKMTETDRRRGSLVARGVIGARRSVNPHIWEQLLDQERRPTLL